MNNFAPFFNQNWLDLPHAEYEQQVTRLQQYLDSHDDQQTFEIRQVV